MPKSEIPVVKKPLFAWVFAENTKLQILLILIIAVNVATRVLPLEMQKRIINEAISLRKIDLLLIYCGIYLAAVIAQGGLKYLINYLQALIGERTLARMRKALYHHILALPLSFFRRTQPGMVVSAIVTEIATAGDFVGMALAVPLTSLLTLLAFAVYLIWLNPLLGIISLSIYPLALFLVPVLQRRANQANVKRVDATREISSRIGESITGIHEIQGHGAFRIENSKFDRIVDRMRKIRIVWNLYRFAVKVTNNFFTNLSPFLIFIVGGYLAMQGRLELGALVAFLSAQEKLYDPWKELINFYQVYQDSSVRYKRTMEYFDDLPDHALEPEGRTAYELENAIQVKNLSMKTDTGITLLDGINFELKPGEHLAVVGFSGSGKSTLAQCIAQLYKYTGGQVLIGGEEVASMTKQDVVRNMGFVSQAPFTFAGTIEDNLIYALQASTQDGNGDTATVPPTRDDLIAVVQQTGIFVDVLRFGLNTMLPPGENEDLAHRLVQVRKNFQQEFGQELGAYVEFFQENRYLHHSSVAENLVFGTPVDASFNYENLSRNAYFREFLTDADLTRPFLKLGEELSRATVSILGALPPEDIFFEESPLSAEELDDYRHVVEVLKQKNLHQLTTQEQDMLLTVALRFTAGRHKMLALPDMLEGLILEGRALFREKIMQDMPDAVAYYDVDQYIYSQTILNNIFFGKTTTTNPAAQDKIDQSIIHLLIEEDLLETVAEIGLQFEVGSKGDKLSGGQRQKLAIARAFLKEPRILIMDEATSALDNKSQARIQNLLETRWKGKTTLLAVIHRLDTIKNFDKIAVMKAGKIGEMGSYDELMERKGMLYELVSRH
jgi:ABC-type multidrug transport system fused ATPase/permease subunit